MSWRTMVPSNSYLVMCKLFIKPTSKALQNKNFCLISAGIPCSDEDTCELVKDLARS